MCLTWWEWKLPLLYSQCHQVPLLSYGLFSCKNCLILGETGNDLRIGFSDSQCLIVVGAMPPLLISPLSGRYLRKLLPLYFRKNHSVGCVAMVYVNLLVKIFTAYTCKFSYWFRQVERQLSKRGELLSSLPLDRQ